MTRLQPSAEAAAKIDELMHSKSPVTFSGVARTLGVTAAEAAELLPESVTQFVTGDASERFPEIWEALCAWEKVTLFIVHAGNVFEIEGRLHAGKIGQGYYNILSRHATIGGHLNYQDVGSVCFAQLPFMGRESLSVQFFTRSGEVAFAVYAGREDHRIIPSVREAYFEARARLTTGCAVPDCDE